MHIIFERVPISFNENYKKISPRLPKLQLAKVGAFFSETQCIVHIFRRLRDVADFPPHRSLI